MSHFDGWADSDPDVGEVMRNLVASQIQYGLSEISDLQSSLLRSEVDEKVLKAMQAVKEEAEKAGEDYEYSLGPKDTKARHNSVEGTSAIEQSNYSAQNSVRIIIL